MFFFFLFLQEIFHLSSFFFCFRRLHTLNKCASMKLDVNLPKKKVSVAIYSLFNQSGASAVFLFDVLYCMEISNVTVTNLMLHFIYCNTEILHERELSWVYRAVVFIFFLKTVLSYVCAFCANTNTMWPYCILV